MAEKSAKKPVPKVLAKAKADAKKTISAGGKPWDKGHWSNRK
jgi:hypothetical protein